MRHLVLQRAGDYGRLIGRYWYVPITFGALLFGGLRVAAPDTTYQASGRIGFIVEVSYFELEPVRNALVARLHSDAFAKELEQVLPGSATVDLFGDEAYRPLGFFDLEGRGADPEMVTRTTQVALDLLRTWINEQRADVSTSEFVAMVEVRPVGAATERSVGGWLVGAGLTGLLVGSIIVVVARSGDLPVRSMGDVVPFVGSVPIFGLLGSDAVGGGEFGLLAARWASGDANRVIAVDGVPEGRQWFGDAMHAVVGDSIEVRDSGRSTVSTDLAVLVIDAGRTTGAELQHFVRGMRSLGLRPMAVVAK